MGRMRGVVPLCDQEEVFLLTSIISLLLFHLQPMLFWLTALTLAFG
jgi:hypothetical protein